VNPERKSPTIGDGGDGDGGGGSGGGGGVTFTWWCHHTRWL
jgi:hypothetical protein